MPIGSAQQTPGLVWDWTAAALGAAYALPAAVVVLSDRSRGGERPRPDQIGRASF